MLLSIDPLHVALRRTGRILQVAQISWGLFVLLYLYQHAYRITANCVFQCVLTLLLDRWIDRRPTEKDRLRAAHLALLSMSLGLAGNALLSGGVHSIVVSYLSCVPLAAALMLGIRAAVLWTLINSALIWIVWWVGPRVTPEYVFTGAMLAGTQMILIMIVAVAAGVYERTTADHVRAVERTQRELLIARDTAVASGRAVREILDNVTFGFFVMGPDLLVQEQCTRSCEALFRTERVAGRRLFELLPQMSVSEVLGFEMQLEQVFADLLPPELSLGQAQQRFVVAGRALHIEGRALYDDAAAVKAVLFTVSDVTDLESSQEQARHHKLLVELLQDRESFREFIRETFAALDAAGRKLALGEEPACRLTLHTIKGNAGAHGLLRLMAVVHGIESQPSLQEDDLMRVRQELRGFLLENRGVLDINPDDTDREVFEVSMEKVRRLSELISMLPAAQQRPLLDWVAQVLTRPAQIFLGPVEQMVQRIAERSGKLVRLEQQGLDTPVDPQRMSGVLQALPHLIRNAVDHGLEPPEGRGGKPPCGTLVLDLNLTPEAYVVTVRDDGRGIDTERLVAKAIGLGLLTPEAAACMSPQEAMGLIFCEGLSTAEEITEISGRGVGMASIHAAVEAAGGRLSVESVLGHGTRFHVIVPRGRPEPQDPLPGLERVRRSAPPGAGAAA